MTEKKKGHAPEKSSTSTSETSTATSHDERHRVVYVDSSGQPCIRCSRCNDTIVRKPHMSGRQWDQAVEVFKRQHGVL